MRARLVAALERLGQWLSLVGGFLQAPPPVVKAPPAADAGRPPKGPTVLVRDLRSGQLLEHPASTPVVEVHRGAVGVVEREAGAKVVEIMRGGFPCTVGDLERVARVREYRRDQGLPPTPDEVERRALERLGIQLGHPVRYWALVVVPGDGPMNTSQSLAMFQVMPKPGDFGPESAPAPSVPLRQTKRPARKQRRKAGPRG